MRHFAKLVRLFPHSKLARNSTVLRVYAFEDREPPVIERAFEPPIDPQQILDAAREFAREDCAVEIDCWWDLWEFDGDWKIAPAGVTLFAFGPQFDRDPDDHMRIEFGVEARFLPQADIPGSPRMSQSNLRSLLHLVHSLDDALNIEKRNLWSESGENFADHLARLAVEPRG